MEKTDKEIVSGMLSDNENNVFHLFFEECKPIFNYIADKIFQYQINKDALINEFYIYLRENNWHRLRQFNYNSDLKTWISAVAFRFFSKKRAKLIHPESSKHLLPKNLDIYHDIYSQDAKILLKELKNERYSYVIQALVLEEREPQELANEMGITVNNLYLIKLRALLQLKKIIENEEGYV